MVTSATTDAPKKGVKYTFAGQYYYQKGDGTDFKDYILEIVFPESTPKALTIFRGSLLDTTSNIFRLMKQKYPDYVRFRTHTIIGEENLAAPNKAPNSIDCMNIEQLAQYVKDNDLYIDVEIFGEDITSLRQAISECEANPEAFKEKYAELKEEFEVKKALNDLNPVVTETTPVEAETQGTPDADDLLQDLSGNESKNDNGKEDDDIDLG